MNIIDKMNIKFFFLILLPLLCLPAFRLPVPNATFYVFYIVLLPIILLICIFKTKFLISQLKLLYQYTPFKFLFFWVLYILGIGFLLCLFGLCSFAHLLYHSFFTVMCIFIFPYILSTIFYSAGIEKHFLIKYTIFSSFIIFLLGIIFYIGYKYNITFIQFIHSVLDNERFLLSTKESFLLTNVRAVSVFSEPSWFGEYIFLNLPIIIGLCYSRYKIFQNKYLNFVIKKTLFPLAILCLILTKSPIWIIFSSILIFLYFLPLIYVKFVKKPMVSILILFMIFLVPLVLFQNNNITSRTENSLLQPFYRISTVLNAKNNIAYLAFAEGSFANRIMSSMAEYKLFLKYPLFGVGLINSQSHVFDSLVELHLPFTPEMQENLYIYYSKGKMPLNGSIFFILLCETGIVGFILFYIFLYKTIRYTRIISKKYSGIERIFLLNLSKSYLALLLVSIYTGLLFTSYSMWFFIGLICPFVIGYYQQSQR